MENIYLNSSGLSWKVFIKYYILAILLGATFIVMESLGIIQINAEVLNNIVLSGINIFIIIQAINPKLNKCIVDELSFRSESLAVIIIPILTAAITRILTNILQVIPILFGGEVIGIAKGQMNMSTFSPIERIFVGTIVGPFFEEFLFRVVFFTTIAYIVGFIDSKFGYELSKKIFNLRSMLCWGLIIIGNILFSLSHVPDASNFHLYFIGGVIDTIIYIKYGFYASWLSHGFYNYFSFAFIFSMFRIG
ncbi:CPBP family intramembrane glutamic endopeptidase [Clostridium sp. 'White wine YQ']|uniref:CPBP family intramembrane glutamic endopeptidase n=1 Tax=Clostridium sp. 'White wine YQ' TaxID=3027474 RepID=UPI0023665936|nr:CPBP family intramembrane glutamic endopeptidase [Clostridium sp. 'White wine YQ']MDD7794789.1 CPBP family intramembrane metalloprotease [Clostridium sp. 'White wine YQ']